MSQKGHQEMTTTAKDIVPSYATSGEIRERLGIPHGMLHALVRQGQVRTLKVSRSRQAQRLYRVDDLQHALTDSERTGEGAL